MKLIVDDYENDKRMYLVAQTQTSFTSGSEYVEQSVVGASKQILAAGKEMAR